MKTPPSGGVFIGTWPIAYSAVNASQRLSAARIRRVKTASCGAVDPKYPGHRGLTFFDARPALW
jgi:hypothetical protein